MRNSFFVTVLSIALVGELIFFGHFYFFGTHGHKKVRELRGLQETIDVAVVAMQQEVSELEKQLYDFKTYPYYKEKIVREQLQMMKENEVIYKRPE